MARPVDSERGRGAGAAEQVEHAILERLRAGELRAGDRLPPERELVERLGASRPVVREAISRLSSAGLVESRQGSGTYLAEVDVAAITHVRLLLEPEAAALAARARTDAQVRTLHDTVQAMGDVIDDRPVFAQLDARIHAMIATACG